MGNIKNILKKGTVVYFLIVILITMTVIKGDSFLNIGNILNIMVQISVYGVVAFAMTFAIICAEFDLSVSSTFAMSTILYIDMSHRLGVLSGILIALVFGLAIGSINGIMVAKVKVNAFIATMAVMVSVKGLALLYTNGKPVMYNNDTIYNIGNGTLAGIPFLVIIFIVMLALSQIILYKTKFGRGLYATGGNIKVSELAGINVNFYKFAIFLILGFMASLGGVLFASRTNSGSALYGGDLALYCVAATVIGGTRLSGGMGNTIRTFLGLLVMGLLFNSLTILGVQALYQDVTKGIILILVVSLDTVYKNSKFKMIPNH